MHTCGDCCLGVRCFGGLFGCGLIATWLRDFVNSVVLKINLNLLNYLLVWLYFFVACVCCWFLAVCWFCVLICLLSWYYFGGSGLRFGLFLVGFVLRWLLIFEFFWLITVWVF